MLTMFFGKRNKLKVFILWRVRAELNFSFFLMIIKLCFSSCFSLMVTDSLGNDHNY